MPWIRFQTILYLVKTRPLIPPPSRHRTLARWSFLPFLFGRFSLLSKTSSNNERLRFCRAGFSIPEKSISFPKRRISLLRTLLLVYSIKCVEWYELNLYLLNLPFTSKGGRSMQPCAPIAYNEYRTALLFSFKLTPILIESINPVSCICFKANIQAVCLEPFSIFVSASKTNNALTMVTLALYTAIWRAVFP